MKKHYLLLTLLIVLSVSLFAQNKTLFLSESFANSTLPDGWEALTWPIASVGWIISNTTQAGGDPHELGLSYTPTLGGGVGRMASPVIDLSNPAGVLMLEFQYKVQVMMEPCKIGVATTSDNGTTWNVVYEQEYDAITEVIHVSEVVNTPDVGSDNFRICFYFQSLAMDLPIAKRWYIDNVLLFSITEYDAQMLSIDGVGEATEQGRNEVGFTFINKGSETITSLEASYQFGDLGIVTEVFESLNIAQNEEFSLTFTNKTLLELDEDYLLTVTVSKINGEEDQVPENSTLSATTHTYMTLANQRLVIDHFTSSMCAPCLQSNVALNSFVEAYLDQIVITKYQIDIPALDPYYNPDGAIRKAFYSVNTAPNTFFNANKLNGFNFAEFYKIYSQQQKPLVDIGGTFRVEGTTIYVDLNVAAYEDLNEVVVYVAVNEKHTTGNVGNNGETDFYHVMMKMLPNGNGTATTLVKYDTKHFSFEHDMSTTFAEEYDDFEVTVFVQDPNSKVIYNGNYLIESTQSVSLPPANLILTQTTPTAFTAQWNAPAKNNHTGFNVYLDGKIVASNISDNNYTFETTDYDVKVVKVSAVYPQGIESVRIADYIILDENFIVDGIEEYKACNISIYPNPADDYVIVDADNIINKIEVYNILNQTIDIIQLNNVSNTIKINTGKYSKGVYLFKITLSDSRTLSKKVIVE